MMDALAMDAIHYLHWSDFSLPFDQDGNHNAKNMVKIIIFISYNENIWGLF